MRGDQVKIGDFVEHRGEKREVVGFWRPGYGRPPDGFNDPVGVELLMETRVEKWTETKTVAVQVKVKDAKTGEDVEITTLRAVADPRSREVPLTVRLVWPERVTVVDRDGHARRQTAEEKIAALEADLDARPIEAL